jgi:hypothetical protein
MVSARFSTVNSFNPCLLMEVPKTKQEQAILAHYLMSRPKATMSFEKGRKALLQRMSAKSASRVVRTIRFRNQDVPKFLKNLDRFERASRKSRLVAK